MLNRARAVASAPLQVQHLTRAFLAVQKGDYGLARALYEKALPEEGGPAGPDPERASAHYNLGCIYSLASVGKAAPKAKVKPLPPDEASRLRAKALIHLRRAFELGCDHLNHFRKNPILDPLRELPEFKALLAEWEEKLKKEKEGKGK
ncbi:MAG: TPR end-of-group domain-containing protein, partial [Planctomycetota bacterium]|jgi:hypothetical protein